MAVTGGPTPHMVVMVYAPNTAYLTGSGDARPSRLDTAADLPPLDVNMGRLSVGRVVTTSIVLWQ